jgi:hypothetical protein
LLPKYQGFNVEAMDSGRAVVKIGEMKDGYEKICVFLKPDDLRQGPIHYGAAGPVPSSAREASCADFGRGCDIFATLPQLGWVFAATRSRTQQKRKACVVQPDSVNAGLKVIRGQRSRGDLEGVARP